MSGKVAFWPWPVVKVQKRAKVLSESQNTIQLVRQPRKMKVRKNCAFIPQVAATFPEQLDFLLLTRIYLCLNIHRKVLSTMSINSHSVGTYHYAILQVGKRSAERWKMIWWLSSFNLCNNNGMRILFRYSEKVTFDDAWGCLKRERVMGQF